MTGAELSLDEARRLALRAQGLLGSPGHGTGAAAVSGLLRRLRAVQLDTISVLARSHELIPYARLGAIGRDRIEQAFWSGDCFEYWAHAACILPVEDWPLYAFRRRHYLERGMRWHDRPADEVFAAVRARLADGPAGAGELGGAKKGGPWWDWSGAKIAVEFMLDCGEVVCSRREGWRRIYDLAERAVPAEHRVADVLDDAGCFRELLARAGAAMGVATAADLADYPRISRAAVAAALPETSLVPVRVAGWTEQAWADPAALETLGARGRHRTTLLSPFDSLVWDRPRTKRLFGFVHALEAYKPAPKREHGYFAMPLLAGGRLLGRVDPKRDGKTLVGVTVGLEKPAAVAPMAAALWEAASWVGAEEVRVDRVVPDALTGAVREALLG
ncbi:MAG: winged helix-turn-helix domain-containing protein [Sporichthyaceae bacterium]